MRLKADTYLTYTQQPAPLMLRRCSTCPSLKHQAVVLTMVQAVPFTIHPLHAAQWCDLGSQCHTHHTCSNLLPLVLVLLNLYGGQWGSIAHGMCRVGCGPQQLRRGPGA